MIVQKYVSDGSREMVVAEKHLGITVGNDQYHVEDSDGGIIITKTTGAISIMPRVSNSIFIK